MLRRHEVTKGVRKVLRGQESTKKQRELCSQGHQVAGKAQSVWGRGGHTYPGASEVGEVIQGASEVNAPRPPEVGDPRPIGFLEGSFGSPC